MNVGLNRLTAAAGWPAHVASIAVLLTWMSLAVAAPQSYDVDGDATSLRIIVRRQGALAALGHDHVLVAKGVSGRIVFDPDAPASSAGELHVPVASIEVDDPRARAQERFTGEVGENDRASVRRAMLEPDQLAAATSPRIDIVLERAEGSLPVLKARVRVRIRQQEQALALPVSVMQDGGMMKVGGETDLLQSAFGIVPYSTLFGAIAVEDKVHVRFEIVARAARP